MAKEASFEAALSFAAELIRIPGLSGKEADVARRVRDEMETLGLAEFSEYTRERLELLDELAREAKVFQLRWVLAGEKASP